MGAIRVVLADDHRLMLEAVKRTLEDEGGFQVVAEAHTGSQVLPLVGRSNPDVVVLDLRLPGMDGLTCIELIRKRHPNVKTVVLSMFADPEHVQAALKRGASAYIAKTVNPADLPAALRQAVEGTVYHVLGLPEANEESSAKVAGLSDRETEILQAAARGLTNKQIAKELWVTEQTVKFHLTNVYRKLKASNRTEAVRYAYQRSLVEHPLHALYDHTGAGSPA